MRRGVSFFPSSPRWRLESWALDFLCSAVLAAGNAHSTVETSDLAPSARIPCSMGSRRTIWRDDDGYLHCIWVGELKKFFWTGIICFSLCILCFLCSFIGANDISAVRGYVQLLWHSGPGQRYVGYLLFFRFGGPPAESRLTGHSCPVCRFFRQPQSPRFPTR
ncbi:hypothetical protein L209DRAFT_514408 [Thermothelomyces heterothallicus CBS 203.75]